MWDRRTSKNSIWPHQVRKANLRSRARNPSLGRRPNPTCAATRVRFGQCRESRLLAGLLHRRARKGRFRDLHVSPRESVLLAEAFSSEAGTNSGFRLLSELGAGVRRITWRSRETWPVAGWRPKSRGVFDDRGRWPSYARTSSIYSILKSGNLQAVTCPISATPRWRTCSRTSSQPSMPIAESSVSTLNNRRGSTHRKEAANSRPRPRPAAKEPRFSQVFPTAWKTKEPATRRLQLCGRLCRRSWRTVCTRTSAGHPASRSQAGQYFADR